MSRTTPSPVLRTPCPSSEDGLEVRLSSLFESNLQLASTAGLCEPFAPHTLDHLMGTRKPKQAQEANDGNLTDHRKSINEERRQSANNGGFDQIEHAHVILSAFSARRTGRGRFCAGSCDPGGHRFPQAPLHNRSFLAGAQASACAPATAARKCPAFARSADARGQ